jgi:hypothetical protein
MGRNDIVKVDGSIDYDYLGESIDGLNSQMAHISNNFGKFIFPELFNAPVELLQDIFKYGATYNSKFNIQSKKIKNGGKAYYVSPNGNDTNDGLTYRTPLKNINTAVAKTDIETLYLLEGDYFNENYTTQILINKSINIIGVGTVKIFYGIKLTEWTQNDTYPNIYQTSRPDDINKVLLPTFLDENGDERELQRVITGLADIANTPYSYGTGNALYVNVPNMPDDKNIAVIGNDSDTIYITNDESDNQVDVYMENIQIIGGNKPMVFKTQPNKTNYNHFYGYKCRFAHAIVENGFNLKGGFSVLVNCLADHNNLDGFNYHLNDSTVQDKLPYAIEINCVARKNGQQDSGDMSGNNGSSVHDGGKIIRINGDYSESQGGNVADISASTMSINLNCIAHNSRTTDETYNSNFTAFPGAKMWLIDCLSYGSNFDLRADSNGIIYIKNNQLEIGVNNENGGTIISL